MSLRRYSVAIFCQTIIRCNLSWQRCWFV